MKLEAKLAILIFMVSFSKVKGNGLENNRGSRERSDRKTNKLQSKVSGSNQKKPVNSNKGPSRVTNKNTSTNSKPAKVPVKVSSESSEGIDEKPVIEVKEIDILDGSSNGAQSVGSEDEGRVEIVNADENGEHEDAVALESKITEMESRIENLEEELREVAALEVSLLVYGVLISALCDAGRVKAAVYYADELKRAGLSGNAVIYNSLTKLYTKVGYLKEAQEAYKLLQSSEEGPAVYSSNCMIGLYTKQSMVDPAKEIFETLKKNGTAYEFSFTMMLFLYKKIERFDEAIQIAKQMRKLGLLTDSLSYNNVLDLYANVGRPKELIQTFKDMVTASIQLDDDSLRTLRNLLLRYGASRQALDKLNFF